MEDFYTTTCSSNQILKDSLRSYNSLRSGP